MSQGNLYLGHSGPYMYYAYIISVKLSSGFNKSMGAVLIIHGKAWHAVCDKDFENNDARVVCRTLGYKDGKV